MSEGRTFSIVREVARKELDRHQRRFLGITSNVPRYIDQGDTDTEAHMEWVVDVRMDIRQYGGKDFKPLNLVEGGIAGAISTETSPTPEAVIEPVWGLLKNVVISQWAVGAVSDMNIPVLMERSESGRITVIARSAVRLPDIVYKTYSYSDLGFIFMSGLKQDTDGDYYDAFGYPATDPSTVTGASLTYTWDHDPTAFGSTDFVWGQTLLGGSDPKFVQSS